jgi:hypothetical protein
MIAPRTKINHVAQDFLEHCRKRATPSRKKPGVKQLQWMAWTEWNRLYGQRLADEAAQKKLELQQKKIALQQHQAQLQQQKKQLEEQAAMARARARWTAALAKVNALLGPQVPGDIQTKMLDPTVWPEFFDPQHRPRDRLEPAVQSWTWSTTDDPFEVFLAKTFLPAHQGEAGLDERVRYLTPGERDEYEVKIMGGRFTWAKTGEPVHTGAMHTYFSGQGHAIWVCSPARRFYSANHEVGSFHHSSFLAGLPVMGAGEWSVDHGRLVMISNKTGHYRAGARELFQVMLRLSVHGVDLSSVVVFWPWPSNQHRRYYRALDFMRGQPAERFCEPKDQAGKPLVQVAAPPLPAPIALI